ncbi:MAG: 2,3-bisphosphoglycerate-independent phosphoglycerate mutase [Flavobacteriales bacterium]|nr:2,3-bisphosphoglycerate-independent phosphoglycerate mutase [Flavobacteriales bacterium]
MKKVALLILDGWGHGNDSKSNAMQNADTSFVDSLYKNYPNAELLTDGEQVGLPAGQMGNSEVGHLNIGAGRVVYQDLVKINHAVKNDTFKDNKTLNEAFAYAKDNNKSVHFMGLVSDGGIHAHETHLHHLCELADTAGLSDVFVHAFTDGRDTDPKSGKGFIQTLESKLSNLSAELVSVIGRYYAMDRDTRWERVKLAYDLLVHAEGEKSKDLVNSIQASYDSGVTDEFVKPIVKVDANGTAKAKIEEGDLVICFNFRTDRCREISRVLTQEDFPEYHMAKLDLNYVTMTMYDESYKNVSVLFHKDNLQNTLGEVLSAHGKTQIRIAETEKYPHVSFFFSGGREQSFEGEKRIMIPSPKVATYDLQPSMSAQEITNAIVSEMEDAPVDFICLNFANPDMVGHTGVYDAVVEALETVDQCAKQVVEAGLKQDYTFLIIADHGNADYMINDDGTPNTAHTTNPVPCFLLNSGYSDIKNGKLADVAPSILKMMGIDIPKEMNGNVLVG